MSQATSPQSGADKYDFEYTLTDDGMLGAIERGEVSSCGVKCAYHDGVPHAPCCELDRPRLFRAVSSSDPSLGDKR